MLSAIRRYVAALRRGPSAGAPERPPLSPQERYEADVGIHEEYWRLGDEAHRYLMREEEERHEYTL